jgi:hypothetical protein
MLVPTTDATGWLTTTRGSSVGRWRRWSIAKLQQTSTPERYS